LAIKEIKKRDGTVVAFEPKKILEAIGKAMKSVIGKEDGEKAGGITDAIVAVLEDKYTGGGLPDVEEVQDLVEERLMKEGLYDVARAYILYRERHRQIREAKRGGVLGQIATGKIIVRKRNGMTEPFDEDKLRNFVQLACRGYEGVVDPEELLFETERGVHDGIETSMIAELAILTTKAKIEKDPIYADITSRMFLNNLYKEVVGSHFTSRSLDAMYRDVFVKNIRKGVEKGLLNPDLLKFNLEELAEYLDLKRDELLNDTGLQTLYDRYFIKDIGNGERRYEAPQMFWMRVAMGLAVTERNREEYAAKFYEVLSSLRFVCSTPTLFNSGTTHQQLSSCYLTTVEDDLEHIFKCIGDNAQLSKWSGGLGNDWSSIRATGSLIKSTGVESQGVIPFLKIANDTTVAINRSGKRRGATCAYLEVWHMDFEDFIDLRRNTGDERRRTHDMDTAAWIPDLFMKRVLKDGEWTLFSPEEVPDLHHIYGSRFEQRYEEYERKAEKGEIKLFRKIKAKELWRRIITSLFETGHPWITFKDPSNVRSPQDHVGVVHSSNLCTEITLNTSKDETAVCNLGSVNFAKHVVHGTFDEMLIKDTVTTAMRMLDNVIDINYYPTKEAKTSNMRHRPVGLGIMGFQDALYLLGINFDTEEAVKFADESMELVSYYAIMASVDLARERGQYETFKGSKWDRGILPRDTLDLLETERGMRIDVPREGKLDWEPVRKAIKAHGMRNSNTMAIAPTATISNISGCYPSIEPIYKVIYVKSNMSGEFTIVNRELVEDLKAIGMWNGAMLDEIKYRDGSIQSITRIPKEIRDRYKCVFDMQPEWLIKSAAARGKWIDQSQSLNIFTSTTSGKLISDAYMYAWSLGLKTTYYLRSLGASTIEKSSIDVNKWKSAVAKDDREAAAAALEAAAVQERMIAVATTADSVETMKKREEIQKQAAAEGVTFTFEGEACEACQ
jgi:ribonucleoside-diphosphate reductase alpha chain